MFYLYDNKYCAGRYFNSYGDLTDWLASAIVCDNCSVDDFQVSQVIMRPLSTLSLASDVLEKVKYEQPGGEELMEG